MLTVLLASCVASAIGSGVNVIPGLINVNRCAEAKAKDPSVLTVVSIVSSVAHEFDARRELRQKVVDYAQSLQQRQTFRPSVRARNIRFNERPDVRRVCLQSLFVISPWKEFCGQFKTYKHVQLGCLPSKSVFHGIVKEAEIYEDVLIAPTIIDNTTNARELMHALAWSRSRVPWADYVLTSDAGTHIKWDTMIELFPPPGRKDFSLWYLGMASGPNVSKIFFRGAMHADWKPCATDVLHGFSRDLVKQIVATSIASQLHVAFNSPLHVQLRGGSQPGV